MKIYDCFNFFNELDLLEIRLNTLKDSVDYFVIVESNVTHSGQFKPLYYKENKKRFRPFEDKIIHYVVMNTPNQFVNLPRAELSGPLQECYDYIEKQTNRFNRATQPDYGRDFFQKESVRRAIYGKANDDDLILISDLDEIPNPQVLDNIDLLDIEDNLYSLQQPMFCYYINMLKQEDWFGTKLGLYKNVRKYSFNEIRGNENLTIKIPNGGWHFSFLGGGDKVIEKLKSYSANDLATDHVISSVESNIENGIDPFFRGKLRKMELDSSFPKYILENKETFTHLIKQ